MTRWLTKMVSSEDDSRNLGHDAGEFGEAWRQFAHEDAARTGSPELERRVIAAWEALQLSKRRSQQPRPARLIWAVGAVAGAVLLAVALRSQRATSIPAAPAPGAATPMSQSTPAAHAVMTWAVDPALETETLQLVRVRMPRLALQAVGVVVSGPNTDGLVEVDVVLGEDGLPRDIRRVALLRQ
jgi:hypothetical protein